MLFPCLLHTCLVNRECTKQPQIDLMLTILRGTVHSGSRLWPLNMFQLDSRRKTFGFGEVECCQECTAGTLPRCFCFGKIQLGTRCTFLGLHLVEMCQQGKSCTLAWLYFSGSLLDSHHSWMIDQDFLFHLDMLYKKLRKWCLYTCFFCRARTMSFLDAARTFREGRTSRI